jgi:hypothetical protein
MSSPFLKLWGMPLLLGLLTTIGLLSALLGDGIWDILSAVALGIPVVIGLWYSLRGWRN